MYTAHHYCIFPTTTVNHHCRARFARDFSQLIVYTDDGKAHSTTSTASVPPPSLRYTFGVTSSTDLLSSVGKTFLRCEFNGEVVEMDVKGVYRMMAELERARNTMELLEGGD